MKRYLLDKQIDVDTDYRAESDKAFVINEVGTNSADKVILKIAGSPVLEIFDKIAGLAKTDDNNNGLKQLGDLNIIVPPDKPFRFEGEAGKSLRIKGSIQVLEPAEALPAGLLARYTEQSKIFKSYQKGSYEPTSAVSVSAGQEMDVINFTCPAGEKWTFNDLYMAEQIDADGSASDQFYSRIYVDDLPFDVIEAPMGPKGICCGSAPYPSRDARNKDSFSLAKMPIELTSGRTLRVSVINTGGRYPSTGTTDVRYWVALVGIKEYA